jgi:hypothetical protein
MHLLVDGEARQVVEAESVDPVKAMVDEREL